MPIDYKNYPENWKEMRQQVLDRVGHCCEHCGVPNYAVGYWAQNGSFEVLHLGSDATDAKTARLQWQFAHFIHSLLLGKLKKVKVIMIVLTVAHLDHDEWNHEVELDRLAALCQRCHFAYDRQDNVQRKKYGKQYKRYQLTIV